MRRWLKSSFLGRLVPGLGERGGQPTAAEIASYRKIFGLEPPAGGPLAPGVERTSAYLPMADGVRLAVDVHLPGGQGPGRRLPCILMPTRYWRRADLRWPANVLRGTSSFVTFMARRGYAVVVLDVRGSGASFGRQTSPWDGNLRADLARVLDWIVAQPWSSGAIGATGGSYVGTAAEFAASLAHPALKAVVPTYSLYDTYADVAFPGGILNDWFATRWGALNMALDAGRLPSDMPLWMRLFARGPAPVDGAEAELPRALAEHATNSDVRSEAGAVVCRDDPTCGGVTVDDFSPHAYRAETQAGGAAVLSLGGWLDGAYARSVLSRFNSLANPSRVVVGPWNHGATQESDPLATAKRPVRPSLTVQYLEILRFFNHYLKKEGPAPACEAVYFCLGAGAWRRSPVWPPPAAARVLHFGPRGSLLAEPPSAPGPVPGPAPRQDVYAVDFDLGSGGANRWRTQLDRRHVRYPDRSRPAARMLTYTSPPLAADCELTGTPVLTLRLASDREDGAVFAYLEVVDETGRATLVTEGCLRLLHRAQSPAPCWVDGPYHSCLRAQAAPMVPGQAEEIALGLLPTSVFLRKGQRIRLAVAGADADQFARIPAEGGSTLTVHHAGSRLELPVAAPGTLAFVPTSAG